MNKIFNLFSINLLSVIIIHSLCFLFSNVINLNGIGLVSLFEILFELITPFLLLTMNFKLARNKEKSYFIPNFFLILISSLLGVALGYLNWGVDVGLHEEDFTIKSALLNPDVETYMIEMLLVKINVIGSVVGSIFCSVLLILINRKKQFLD